MISPEQCRSLAKGKIFYLGDQFLAVEYDTKNPIVITGGPPSSTNRNHCTSRGCITRETFLPHIQRTTLKVRMSTGKVLSFSAQVLPSALEELGCETTSLDPYTYGTTVTTLYHQSSELNKLTWLNKVKIYYIISGPNSTTKFVFEVKTNPQNHCRKPTDVYPTNYDSLCVAINSGGSDLSSGRNLGKERNGATQLLQYIVSTGTTDFPNLCLRSETHIPENKWWRYVSEYGLRNAHGNKIGVF